VQNDRHVEFYAPKLTPLTLLLAFSALVGRAREKLKPRVDKCPNIEYQETIEY